MKPSPHDPTGPMSDEEALAFYTELAKQWESAAVLRAYRVIRGDFPDMHADKVRFMFEVADMLIARVAHLEKTGDIR